jgi:hypothetical protein
MKETRGTAEWAYKVTPHGTGPAATRDLIDESGFLWRTVHNTAGRKIASVGKVEVGDTIHLYFSEAGADTYVASYLVQRPVERADEAIAAVDAVRSGALFEQLDEAAYEKDHELKVFTGFRVKRDLYPRPVDQPPRWIGRNAIVRVKR